MRHSTGYRIGARGAIALALLCAFAYTFQAPARAETPPVLVPIISFAGNWVSTETYGPGIVVRYHGQTYLKIGRASCRERVCR